MATYKVLQDIEAEDKLIGPLTLRQCIYAAIAIIAMYLSYLVGSKGATFLIPFFLPFIGFGLFFAFPWTKDQPTEVWALAKVRFALKPRKRIWDQNGTKHLVSVTAPKTVEDPRLRNRMSQNEVRSRLKALAVTVDSRGWATKNVPLDLYTQSANSDRLISLGSTLTPGVDSSETLSDDIFDTDNNPVAKQFNAKISAATSAHRQQLINQLNNPAQPQPSSPPSGAGQQQYWYGVSPQPVIPAPAGTMAMPQPLSAYTQPLPATTDQPVYQQTAPAGPMAATPTPEEEAFVQQLRQRQELLQSADHSSHLKVVLPLSEQLAAEQAAQAAAAQNDMARMAAPAPQPAVTAAPNPATLELASNDDLDIATIAREAHRRNGEEPNEVVVSLH